MRKGHTAVRRSLTVRDEREHPYGRQGVADGGACGVHGGDPSTNWPAMLIVALRAFCAGQTA
jgi:hypothetical protein